MDSRYNPVRTIHMNKIQLEFVRVFTINCAIIVIGIEIKKSIIVHKIVHNIAHYVCINFDSVSLPIFCYNLRNMLNAAGVEGIYWRITNTIAITFQ